MIIIRGLQSFSSKKRLMRELLTKSWWVYSFILLNIIGFSLVYKHTTCRYQELGNTLAQLEAKRDELKRKEQYLTLQIKSLEDPKSVELILKRELGLISEGQTKVHFIKSQ